jgi:hypothetical protein
MEAAHETACVADRTDDAEVEARLDAGYRVHRLFAAHDRAALIAAIGNIEESARRSHGVRSVGRGIDIEVVAKRLRLH